MCVAETQRRVNEQNVSPSARVYMFPSIDLKGQYQCTQRPVCAKLE